MPFNQTDIYTSSGSVKLYNAWTPYVSKYDTSSFYNWEQDNLPLYDLEERTYELWEQAGFATSAGVPGLALTVSATAPAPVLAANRNVFTSLSGCIAAIPKVVRFPVLVEVGSFTDIGALELHNFRIEEGGSIEIINRAFTRAYNASSTVSSINTPTQNASNNLVSSIASQDATNGLTQASCVGLSQKLLSQAPTNAGCTNMGCIENNFIFYPLFTLRKSALSVILDSTTIRDSGSTAQTLGNGTFLFENKAADTYGDLTLSTLDISSTNQISGAAIKRPSVVGGQVDAVGGNVYLNTCSKISVKNCDGPIYIRNFFVDGEQSVDNGIEVTNSEVVLENCAAIRCKQSGFKFNNSKVVLSRSAFSYRNYTLNTTTTRASDTGYGFYSINSEVTLSSLPIPVTSTSVGDTGGSACDAAFIASRNYAGFVLDNSKLTGGITRVVSTQASSASLLGSELNTGYGMLLNNSIIDLNGLVDVYSNDIGIKADNTKFTFEEMCVEANKNEGITSVNSTFTWDSNFAPTNAGQSARNQLDMSANGQHLDLQNNSYFGFTKKNSIPQKYGNSRFSVDHGCINWLDGQHKAPAISLNNNSTVELLHSVIDTVGGSAAATNIQYMPCYGRAIKANNSSHASLYGSKTGATVITGPGDFAYQQSTAGLYADKNSSINIHGPTAVLQFGVDALAENNSTINIEPARAKNSYALDISGFDLADGANHTHVELHSTRACLVANKNSTINIQDLGSFIKNWSRTSNGLAYLASGFDYANTIFIPDVSAYTSSGSLQFYPNPPDSTILAAYTTYDEPQASPGTFPTFTNGGLIFTYLRNTAAGALTSPSWNTIKQITLGGVCVRAVEDSVVNIKNVHFPLGSTDTELDGTYYNASGSECDRLMIWNIADTSRLNASYLSVSGMHPADSSYHGPSAIWVSSDGGAGYRVAYGAPSGTPETGALSILDVFGAGSGVWNIPSGVTLNSPFDRFHLVTGSESANQKLALLNAGLSYNAINNLLIGAPANTSRNQGVFRIYWSPKASAKALQVDVSGYQFGAYPHAGGTFSGVVGPAYQIFAQGYNCSAPVSAVVPTGYTNASALFPDLLKFHDTNNDGIADTLWTSGFYYCSELVEDNPTQCMLDESAAKTFANAQNASVGWAGRPRKVTIYRAYGANTDRISESTGRETNGSIGFKSATIFDLSRDN